MNGNPKEVLSAILGKGGKLTLGRLALLERAKSPVLELDIADLNRDIEAAFLYGAPLDVAVKSKDTLTDSLLWVEQVGCEEYERLFGELIDALVAFYEMLPAQKKTEVNTTATDGLQS